MNMEKLKRDWRSKKREQIVSTAEDLFSRFGAKRVTVDEVCREAGVSKMTFYKHFPNKVELVRSIRDNWVEECFKKFDEINTMDLPFMEKINLMTRWKLEFATRVNAEFIRELVSTDDAMEQFKRRYLGNIKKAQEKGEVRSDIDLEFLWLVMEKLGELVMNGSWKSVCSELSQYQQQLRTLLWFGLLTRKEDEKC
jgi:AcrR family transcriptional regulator